MDEMESRVTALERDLCNLKEIVIDEKRRLNGNLERIGNRLEAMDGKLLAASSKPSWGITATIGFLLSLATGLIVFVVTH